MKLEIISNKEIAFIPYLNNIILLKKWPWIKRGPLEKIPKKLAEKAAKFDPLDVTIDKPIDFSNYGKDFVKLVGQARKLHNKEWGKYKQNIDETHDLIKNVVNNYGRDIVKYIEQATGTPWNRKKLSLVQFIYEGGMYSYNKVLLGYKYGPDPYYFRLIVHEMIHANTYRIEKEIKNKLKLIHDSKEMATMLLNTKIMNKFNKKFKIKLLPKDCIATRYPKAAKYVQDLEEIASKKRTFKTLTFAIDEYLSNKKYKTVYPTA